MVGHIENETTQDDLEGGNPPLGLSRSKAHNPTEGIWTPVIRKGLAVTLGGIALAAIGGISMAHHSTNAPNNEYSRASVPGAEPLEWLAMNGNQDEPRVVQAQVGAPSLLPVASDPMGNGVSSDTESVPSGNKPAEQPKPGGGVLPDGRVVLNLATLSDLQTLPGIGQKRAESIIALRVRLGGFKKLSELLRVKGIGVKSLRKLEPKVTLDPPATDTQRPTLPVASTIPSSQAAPSPP